MDFSNKIAQRSQVVQASGIRKVFDLAANLKDPIDLSIGQPDFDVPDAVKETAIDAIKGGLNRYTPTTGIPALCTAILKRFEEVHGVRPERAMVTSGVSGALTVALMALVNPGDEVLIPDPYFVGYKQLTLMFGGKPVFFDTYPKFRIDVNKIEAALTAKSKVILAMSPGNPTGMCIDEQARQDMADLARRKALIVISDEIYEAFVYAGVRGKSMAAYYPEGTIALSGLSKTASMTGWRLGWAVGPDVLLQAMIKLQQFTFVCAPSFAQQAALTALEGDLSAAVSAYRFKRDRMLSGLREAGYEVYVPDGAFYLFVRVPTAWSCGQAFVEEGVKRGLLTVPGNVFSERDTHVRISYAASDETLVRALDVLRDLRKR